MPCSSAFWRNSLAPSAVRQNHSTQDLHDAAIRGCVLHSYTKGPIAQSRAHAHGIAEEQPLFPAASHDLTGGGSILLKMTQQEVGNAGDHLPIQALQISHHL